MKYVGIVTDPSFYEPFIGIEPTATFKIWFKICEYCDQEYEIYREHQFGRAKGMAMNAPPHLCRQKKWNELRESIARGEFISSNRIKEIME